MWRQQIFLAKWDLSGCEDLLSWDKAVFMQTALNEFVAVAELQFQDRCLQNDCYNPFQLTLNALIQKGQVRHLDIIQKQKLNVGVDI